MKPIWKRVDKGVIDPVKDHSEETMVAGFRVRRIMRPTTAKSYSGFKPHHFHVLGKTGEMYRFDTFIDAHAYATELKTKEDAKKESGHVK